MRCYRCNRGIADQVSMVPIDPKGPNRRWACMECLTDAQRAAIPKDVIDLSAVFNTEFDALKCEFEWRGPDVPSKEDT